MIKLERKFMMRAIDRARQLRPRVKFLGERRFAVESARHAGTTYHVTFHVTERGERLGECDCPAGRAGQVCYHLAGAAQANIMIQSMRRGASPRVVTSIRSGVEESRMQAFITRNTGWML